MKAYLFSAMTLIASLTGSVANAGEFHAGMFACKSSNGDNVELSLSERGSLPWVEIKTPLVSLAGVPSVLRFSNGVVRYVNGDSLHHHLIVEFGANEMIPSVYWEIVGAESIVCSER
jgi:hypothetical protein